MNPTHATLIGLTAIVLWSFIVACIRVVSESFGIVGGAALMYSLATTFLILTVGFTNLRNFPKRYLWLGSLLFVSYELCLAFSIGFAENGRQAIEVGMINYLWPTLTIVANIIFNGKKTSWLIVPGVLLSMIGIVWVLSGDQGLDIHIIWSNIKSNPISYLLAFIGAIIWATYCVVTAKYAEGKNGVTLFFFLVSMTLWIVYGIQGEFLLNFTVQSMLYLVLASSALGFGYAAWNIGILRGNIMVLTTASYFIPILSALVASIVLSAALSLDFWQGVVMICLGSMCCFVATRNRVKS